MTRFAAVLSVALLAACQAAQRPTYREPAPTPVQRPAPPPERILRRAPDFRFKEPATGRLFFYRGYRETLPDGTEFKHEVITVLDKDGPYERDASAEERAYAMSVLEKHWQDQGLEAQLAYHAEMARIGAERRDSLIDQKLAYAEEALKDADQHLLELEADLQSSTRTAGYKAPPGRVEFLQEQVKEAVKQQAELKARIETLRYLQAAMDRETPKGSTGS